MVGVSCRFSFGNFIDNGPFGIGDNGGRGSKDVISDSCTHPGEAVWASTGLEGTDSTLSDSSGIGNSGVGKRKRADRVVVRSRGSSTEGLTIGAAEGGTHPLSYIDICMDRSNVSKNRTYWPGDSTTDCRNESSNDKEDMTGGSSAHTMGSVRRKLPNDKGQRVYGGTPLQ